MPSRPERRTVSSCAAQWREPCICFSFLTSKTLLSVKLLKAAKSCGQRDIVALCVANLADAGPEFFYLLRANTSDGAELRNIARSGQHDAAKRGGAEDKKLREAQFFGCVLAPVAETLVELLLLGGKNLRGLRGDGALATKGFPGRRCFIFGSS